VGGETADNTSRVAIEDMQKNALSGK
jgi:hypothetical protein